MRMEIREVRESDCYDLWLWRNNTDVRKWCFETKEITYEDHKKWFSNKIGSKNTKIYLAENENSKKIGQARFEIRDDYKAYINVSLNPDFFGLGLGNKIISAATKFFLGKYLKITEVIAEVIDVNIISQKAFNKAGYKLAGEINKHDQKVKIFVYKENALKKNMGEGNCEI